MDIFEEMELVINRMISNLVMPMNDKEYDVCSFVANEVCGARPYILIKKDVDFKGVCGDAIGLFKIYEDDDLISDLESKISNTTFNKLPVKNSSMSITSFTTLIDTTVFDDDGNFSLKSVGFPEKLGFLSPVYLAHEFHHCLKDINPNEYKYMLRYADVIPLFFELACADNLGEHLKKAIHNNRLGMLSISSEFLKKHVQRSDNCGLLFEFNDSKACQYLNSFYYAICLYDIYKCEPKMVLEDVKRVLFCECTTYDLLNKYDLFSRSRDGNVSDYIKVFQKV